MHVNGLAECKFLLVPWQLLGSCVAEVMLQFAVDDRAKLCFSLETPTAEDKEKVRSQERREGLR